MSTNLEKALINGIAPWKEIEYRSKEFWIFRDGFPVTKGHLLFVPTQESHVNLMACYKAAYQWGINGISANKWDGFNVGQNVGSAAGQTIMYPHVHMIPRRTDDMPDPRGGVRHVIPSQGNYKNEDYKLVS